MKCYYCDFTHNLKDVILAHEKECGLSSEGKLWEADFYSCKTYSFGSSGKIWSDESNDTRPVSLKKYFMTKETAVDSVRRVVLEICSLFNGPCGDSCCSTKFEKCKHFLDTDRCEVFSDGHSLFLTLGEALKDWKSEKDVRLIFPRIFCEFKFQVTKDFFILNYEIAPGSGGYVKIRKMKDSVN